jgi:predicted DNA-binding transcriptional regulator YafY
MLATDIVFAMARRPNPGRPSGQYTQAVRLFQLYHRLEAAPEGMRIDDLAREMGVTSRSIRRDLKALEDAEQALETVTVDGERRVRLARTGKTSEPIRMTRFQRYSLAAVRRVFDVLVGTPIYDDLTALFGKLTPPGGEREGAALGNRFLYIPEAPKNYRRFKDQIYEIYDGVLRSLTLSFTYDGGSTPGSRKLEPYALVLYRNGLYVVGIDVAKRATRTFAVERMRRVKALPQAPFERDPTFDVSKVFDGSFGLIGGGEKQRIVVEFDAKVATFIEERQWHPTQRNTRLERGGVRTELHVAITEELVAWVLRWGASARVIEPAELRERVRSELARGAAQYETATTRPTTNGRSHTADAR